MSTVRQRAGDGRQVAVLTREDIKDALREYAARYGDDFAQSAFSPSMAKRNGWPELVDRYYAGREDGRPWPSLNAIKSKYDGSWNAARADIGLPANSTGPARGRRPPGSAQPIFTRERIKYMPSEKTKALTDRISRLEERLEQALARARTAEADLERSRASKRTVIKGRTVTKVREKTKTVTKTVKVRDAAAERKLAGAERRLDATQRRLTEADARARAIEDQLRAEQRDRNRDLTRFRDAEATAQEARSAVADAERDRDRARDRLVAAESLVERYKGEVEHACAEVMGATEAAQVADLVRQADERADAAEVRAARAERMMAEQGAAVTGEMRRLTAGELDELRAKGPAGELIFGRALKQLATARRRGGNPLLIDALTEIARAAVMWRDRLR